MVVELLTEKISREDCKGLKGNYIHVMKSLFDRERTYPNISKLDKRLLTGLAYSASKKEISFLESSFDLMHERALTLYKRKTSPFLKPVKWARCETRFIKISFWEASVLRSWPVRSVFTRARDPYCTKSMIVCVCSGTQRVYLSLNF